MPTIRYGTNAGGNPLRPSGSSQMRHRADRNPLGPSKASDATRVSGAATAFLRSLDHFARPVGRAVVPMEGLSAGRDPSVP